MMDKQKTIKDATDTELKAILWDLEQQIKPIQNKYQIIIQELQRRYNQLNKGKQTMEEETQPVESTETPEVVEATEVEAENAETPVEETTEETAEEVEAEEAPAEPEAPVEETEEAKTE